ncbi:hypothetical protein CDAR_575351 [Caerostris darwini]|uniref:Uncharacterized protein n=1 Tax=Caerostris darwini TaxID=1538125 RepID=A0AAV4RUQ8_9ARAC|nr:hypothetical protein CDAR_575351 [Caerostris darwini]
MEKMEIEDEDEGKEHINGAEPVEDPANFQGTPDTDRAKEFAKLCISDHPFKEEPGVGSRGTSPRPREGDGGSSREVSYRHPGGGEGGKQPLSVLSTTDSKLLREPREHRHRRYHSGYKSRYSRDISITQMALAEDDNISALQQVTKGGAAAVTLASKWQVSFDDSEETDNEVEAKDNLTSPEHRPLIAQDSPSKLSLAGTSFWANSGGPNKPGPHQVQLLTLALRERERMKRLEKHSAHQASSAEQELHRYVASLNKAFGDVEEKWRKGGFVSRLYPKDLLNSTRTWSCPNLSPGVQILPLKVSASDTNLQELQKGDDRTQEKRNVPSRRHSADIQANSSSVVGEFKRWSMGSTFEKITKKLPRKEEGHLKSSEEAHNEGIKSAPIPSTVKPKGILRKSGSDQPLVQTTHRHDSNEKVFSNKLIVTTIEWESNDKVGNVVKHEVESPTLERQSPATPLVDIARLHLDEPSVYFDAPQPNEEESDDARRNGGADDEEFDTPPKDDLHSASPNISETRYDDALQYRKRSPTPPNRSGIMYSSGMRRKLKDVDFHVAEAVIEEDKEGGSASDCQSPRRQDSVTQTRPNTEPPFSRSGSNTDDFVRSTIPVHMMDTCREPTPETDSDSWRIAKTGSEESIRPPYMLKPYNRRRPRSMIEGNPRLSYPRDGNRSPNGKYASDFTAKPYRTGDKSPRTATPLFPSRSGVKQKTPPAASDLTNDGGVQSSRSASSSREESDYVETNNRMPLTQKRSDFFTRSISWDAKFRKERSPNSRKASEDKYVRADLNDWRGRYSRRRQRAVLSGSSESRIPRPKGRLRVTEPDEGVVNDFQQPDQRCSGSSTRSTDPQVKSPVSSSLPTLQNERVQQTEVHRNCKSEVLIPRFRPEGGSAYVQPRRRRYRPLTPKDLPMTGSESS